MNTPYYSDATVTLHHGDCLDVLRELPDASVDAVCTDPPYGLEFMGKEWDAPWKSDRRQGFDGTLTDVRPNAYGRSQVRYGVGGSYGESGQVGRAFQQWCEAWAAECLRVLKPGGHLLAFGGTRTSHRLACAIEDAGFEIRDSIAWLYGSGFPKSLDVSKAIDKAAGAEREVVGRYVPPNGKAWNLAHDEARSEVGAIGHSDRTASLSLTAPATPDAKHWQGWGTALKPAHEPIVVARKPLAGTVAANVLAHGTGALNVDGCRVAHVSEADLRESANKNRHADFGSGPRQNKVYGADLRDRGQGGNYDGSRGRWPANVVLDESQAAELDEQSGNLHSQNPRTRQSRSTVEGVTEMGTGASIEYADMGGASRFFYVAKADASERVRVNGTAHPTVKPLALMRWLVRLVTPPGGTVLEPFAGSGTTVEACILEGFRCVAIEREADYLPLIVQRINRRRDPVAAVKATGDDGGLFDLLGEASA